MNYETIIHSLIVKPEGSAIYSERATIVRMDDEGAGPFVVIEQAFNEGKISVEPEEWPHILAAIEQMMATCTQMGDHDD